MDVITFYGILYIGSTHCTDRESQKAIRLSSWPLNHILHFRDLDRVHGKILQFFREALLKGYAFTFKIKMYSIRQEKQK